MKKRRTKVGIAVGVIFVLSVIAMIVGFSAPKDTAVARINGGPVFEEEFLMLLRQNEMQYENQLRKELDIPEGQSVLTYLDGDESEYRQLLFEQNLAYLTSCRVAQALAQEYGLAPEFTYQGFLEALEAENKSRADKINRGEVIYGLRSFSPEQYYSYYMSNLSQKLQRELPQELLAVSDADVNAYYESIEGGLGADGEITHYTLYDVSAAQALPVETQSSLYHEIEATLGAETYLDLSVGGVVYRAEPRTFTQKELRNFIRQDFDNEFLLSLAENEMCGPFSVGNHWYIAQHNGIEKAKTLTEADKGVFRVQLQESAYEALIAEKTKQADVRVNQAKLKQIS